MTDQERINLLERQVDLLIAIVTINENAIHGYSAQEIAKKLSILRAEALERQKGKSVSK